VTDRTSYFATAMLFLLMAGGAAWVARGTDLWLGIRIAAGVFSILWALLGARAFLRALLWRS
jgi:hypothetical protein